MNLGRARCYVALLIVAAAGCAGADGKPPVNAKTGAPQDPAPANPPGHAGPPCVVQAATTKLCFSTKEEACAAMGCQANSCSYLYGGSSSSMVACDG